MWAMLFSLYRKTRLLNTELAAELEDNCLLDFVELANLLHSSLILNSEVTKCVAIDDGVVLRC